MNAEIWASIGTAVATVVFLVVPVLVYAWYALDEWIGDRDSYETVIAGSRASLTALDVASICLNPQRCRTDCCSSAS